MLRSVVSLIVGLLILAGALIVEVSAVGFFNPEIDYVDPSGPLFLLVFIYGYSVAAVPLAIFVAVSVLSFLREKIGDRLVAYLLAGIFPGLVFAAFLTFRRDAPFSIQLYRSLAGLVAAQLSLLCYWGLTRRAVEQSAGAGPDTGRSLA